MGCESTTIGFVFKNPTIRSTITIDIVGSFFVVTFVNHESAICYLVCHDIPIGQLLFKAIAIIIKLSYHLYFYRPQLDKRLRIDDVPKRYLDTSKPMKCLKTPKKWLKTDSIGFHAFRREPGELRF